MTTGHDAAVAVVGVALRVPGADDTDTFWDMLTAGRIGLPEQPSAGSGDRIAAGQIGRYAEFDTDLFGISPGAATIIDPQHRVLTELTWQALDDAGIDTERHPGRVGVFAGCGPEAYLHDRVLRSPEHVRAHGNEQILLGNSRDYLASMLSYRLGFTGPSMTVQTACSSSLVALHQAVRSLLTYDCDLAVVAGVTVHPPAQPTYTHVPGGIYAPDGRCRTFTQGSQGTVPSSGAGVVVLCRSGEVGHGRHARAHVVGSAINNDGADRLGPTAPSPRGQAEVIRDALDVAGLEPGAVGFVETHGTGTALGDQVELDALNEVYGAAPGGPCVLGAAKVNVGHTDTAAGVVGLIKAVLALEHETIPPTPGQQGDGPDVALGSDRFVLARDARPWSGPSRYAAVSSFGLGGTNAHVILTADETGCGRTANGAAETGHSATSAVTPVLALSAATVDAVRVRAAELAAWLRAHPHDPAGVAATLWHGRRHLPYRWAATVAATGPADDLLAALDRAADPGSSPRRAATDPALAVVLPGQGVELSGVGAGLIASDPAYAADIGELRAAVTAAGGPDLTGAQNWAPNDPRLTDTSVVQPLLFTLGLAALRQLERLGLTARLMLGHSAAEITAATFAGVFDVTAGAAAMVARGRFMNDQEPGAVLAVRADGPAVDELAAGLAVEVSGYHDSQTTLAAGPPGDIEVFIKRCAEERVTTRRLPVNRAYHTSAMADAAERFAGFLQGLPLAAPQRPLVSNMTGAVLTAEQATDPHYWAAQLRSPVRLEDALGTVSAANPDAVLQLHRGRGLIGDIRQALRRAGISAYAGSLLGDGRRDEPAAYADTLAQLWTAGFRVDLAVDLAPMPRLPGYPLAGGHYLIDEPAAAVQPTRTTEAPVTGGLAAGPATAEPAADDVQGGAGDAPDTVSAIWAAAFGVPAVEPDDNFFALGGTSLQAAHLVSVLNEELLVTATLNDLYENSTLREFLARIGSLVAERDDDELLRLLEEIEGNR